MKYKFLRGVWDDLNITTIQLTNLDQDIQTQIFRMKNLKVRLGAVVRCLIYF